MRRKVIPVESQLILKEVVIIVLKEVIILWPGIEIEPAGWAVIKIERSSALRAISHCLIPSVLFYPIVFLFFLSGVAFFFLR
jgi:hypothetical protein